MITFRNENIKGGTDTIINCSILTARVNLKLDLLYYMTCWGQKVHVDVDEEKGDYMKGNL